MTVTCTAGNDRYTERLALDDDVDDEKVVTRGTMIHDDRPTDQHMN
jgi:hypothetical protein